MKRWGGALLILVLSGGAWAGDTLVDFTTDGCSLFPDGSPVHPTLWCECCITHDIAYWRGGTEQERQQADEALRACVAQRTGNQPFAELVYTGVRAGGMPIFPTWYRWGYGWGYGRGYQPLNEEEKATAEQKLEKWRAAHPEPKCEQTRAVELLPSTPLP